MIKFPSPCWLTCVVPSLVLVTTHIYCWSRWNFNPLLACLLYNYYCCTFIHKCWQQPAEMWNFSCINFKSAMKEQLFIFNQISIFDHVLNTSGDANTFREHSHMTSYVFWVFLTYTANVLYVVFTDVCLRTKSTNNTK